MSFNGGSQVIVFLEKPGGSAYECLALNGVPVAKPALILIAAASTGSMALAEDLHEALVTEILASSVSAVETATGRPDEITKISLSRAMKFDCEKVLVLVGDGVSSASWKHEFEP